MNRNGCRLRVRLGGERGSGRRAVVVDDAGAMRALRAAEVLQAVATLRGLARRWSADWTAAEDLLQETVERAFRTLDSYKPGTSAGAWMRTIMFRLAVDESRRLQSERRVQQVFAAQAPVLSDPEPEAPEPSTTPSLAEVHAAARLLHEPFRTAFRLWAVEGKSYLQISKEMGVPVSTVATRLLRARRSLQAAFPGHGGGARRRPRQRQRMGCAARRGPDDINAEPLRT